MNRSVLLVLLAGFAFTQAHADTVYVDDTLRVGVRNNPGNTETPLEVITSGAALEVLERTKGYMRVRTASGAEGWVSTVYVTENAPARVLLEQAKQENARLQNELRTLRGGAAPEQNEPKVNVEMEDLRRENAQLLARLSEIYAGDTGSRVQDWLIEAGVMSALFGFGVFLGKRHERQRVARRFNGLEL